MASTHLVRCFWNLIKTKDTVKCAPRAEVPGHHQEQLMQTLIVNAVIYIVPKIGGGWPPFECCNASLGNKIATYDHTCNCRRRGSGWLDLNGLSSFQFLQLGSCRDGRGHCRSLGTPMALYHHGHLLLPLLHLLRLPLFASVTVVLFLLWRLNFGL